MSGGVIGCLHGNDIGSVTKLPFFKSKAFGGGGLLSFNDVIDAMKVYFYDSVKSTVLATCQYAGQR